MYFTQNNQWVVVGIVSYGYECANPYFAAIYTRVSYFTSWISSFNINDLSIIDMTVSNPNITESTTKVSVTSRSDTFSIRHVQRSLYLFFMITASHMLRLVEIYFGII